MALLIEAERVRIDLNEASKSHSFRHFVTETELFFYEKHDRNIVEMDGTDI